MDVDDMVDNWNSGVKKALDALAEKKTRNLAKRKKIQLPPEVNEKLQKLKEMKDEIDKNADEGFVNKELVKKHNKHKNHCNRLQKRKIMEAKGTAITPKSSTNDIWKVPNGVLQPADQVVNETTTKDGNGKDGNHQRWKNN